MIVNTINDIKGMNQMDLGLNTVRVGGRVYDRLPYKHSKTSMYWQVYLKDRDELRDMLEVVNDDLEEAYQILKQGQGIRYVASQKISSHKIGTTDMELILEYPELDNLIYKEVREGLFMNGYYETLYDYYKKTRGKNAEVPYFLMNGVYNEMYNRIIDQTYQIESKGYKLHQYVNYLYDYLSDLSRSYERSDFEGKPLPYLGDVSAIIHLTTDSKYVKAYKGLWDESFRKIQNNRTMLKRLPESGHTEKLLKTNDILLRELYTLYMKRRRGV